MNNITVTSVDELDGGWLLSVKIGDDDYHVGVGRDYYQQLTAGNESVEQLVRRSFEFLLEREPASAIMRRFELPVIQQYFPEYEATIARSDS